MPYYAVRRGRETGIHENWDDARRSTNGYSNNEFKGFKDRSEAIDYMCTPSQQQRISSQSSTQSNYESRSQSRSLCYDGASRSDHHQQSGVVARQSSPTQSQHQSRYSGAMTRQPAAEYQQPARASQSQSYSTTQYISQQQPQHCNNQYNFTSHNHYYRH